MYRAEQQNNLALLTVREIADALAVPIHRVAYAIARHGVPEVRRVGIIRLYDPTAVGQIKALIDRG